MIAVQEDAARTEVGAYCTLEGGGERRIELCHIISWGVGISISILKHDFSEIEIEKIEKIKNLLKSFFRLTQFTDQSIMFRLPLKLRIQEYNNLYVSLLLGHYR